MDRTTVFNQIEAWSPFSLYEIDSTVRYNGNLYFAIRQNKGMDPLTGLGDVWVDTSKFIWQPSYGTQVNVKVNNKLCNFLSNGGATQIKKDQNKSTFYTINASFQNRSNLQTLAILAFVYNHAGVNSFDFDLQSPYNLSIRCKAKNKSHRYLSYNNNSLEIQLEEVL